LKENLKGKELITTEYDAAGNLDISFKSASVVGTNLALLLAIPIFLLSIAILAFISQYALGNSGASAVITFIGATILTCYFGYKITVRKDKISLIKDQGIKFLNQELPFSSIDQIYITHSKIERKLGNKGSTGVSTCVITARVRGREIAITRSLPILVAEDVVEKIISYYK